MKAKRWCIIPARAGSTRIPGKNWKAFDGIPMVERAIMLAQATRVFHHIVVSTDSAIVIGIASRMGVEWHPRCEEHRFDEVGTQEVVGQVLKDVGAKARDWACCLYTTTPLVYPDDIVRARALLERNMALYAMAVGAHPLRDAGQWYWGKAGNFMAGRPLISPSTRMVPIPEERICDINTPEDWGRALHLYRKLSGPDPRARNIIPVRR